MHGLETYGERAAFASRRLVAWHALGNVFEKDVNTTEMLDLSSLSGWGLRFVDASEHVPGARFAKPTLFVVRDNPFDGGLDVLGTVGARYKIFSNEEILDFGDTMTGGRRRWETAGSINGGTRIFATLASTDDIVLDPNGSADTVRKYLLLTSSHDGSSTMRVLKVNTRVVCKNTLNVAMGEKAPSFSIRHTQGMATKIEDAKRALGFADEYDAAFEAEANALFQQSVTDQQFQDIIKTAFPEPEKDVKGALTKWTAKREALTAVWNGATGSMDNLPNNGWKAFQALIEHNQWFRKVYSRNEENFYAAGAGLDGKTNQFRQDALSLVRSFA